MQAEGPVGTLDEEGNTCDGGHNHYYRASQCILEMIQNATARSDDWKEELQKILDVTDPILKNKMWIVGRTPTKYYVQITATAIK